MAPSSKDDSLLQNQLLSNSELYLNKVGVVRVPQSKIFLLKTITGGLMLNLEFRFGSDKPISLQPHQ
jgi:hypothetical protein